MAEIYERSAENIESDGKYFHTEKYIEKEFHSDYSEKEIFEKRKEKVIKFFKSSQIWVILILIVAILLGVYIRSMPMMDHTQGIPSFGKFLLTPGSVFGGRPGLWDITTNTWTLGPDLDPWLFLRNAKIVAEYDDLPARDYMRNVPLGFDNYIESQLLPHMIYWTYLFFKVFDNNINMEFAGAVFPVVMFILTIISFFLFVREVFLENSKESQIKANLISLIATFFMIVMPVFLSRTVAGIPEKESAAFFFMFLAFYSFMKSLKTKNNLASILLACLSGISTGLLGLIWGGVTYALIGIGTATLLAFILNKLDLRGYISYLIWFVLSLFLILFYSNKFSLFGIIISFSGGLIPFFTLVSIFIHLIIWNTPLCKIKIIKDSKIPKNIITLIITVFLLLLIGGVFFGPEFIIDKFKTIHRTIFKPVLGRWSVTVAENRQPSFTEWRGSFGPHINNVPIMFWLFFAGSILMFKRVLKGLKGKDSWMLTLFYVLFLSGLIFSRYSSSSILNGENIISKFFYYSSVIIFISFLIYYYISYSKKDDSSFQEIDYGFLFLFSLFALALFSARSAVRLIMVLGPIAPIFASYLLVECGYGIRKIKDDTFKIILSAIFVILLLLSIYSFYSYYNEVRGQSFGFIPSSYNMQWQKAMEWVRIETPENAVFGHWWDYGYWLQSIGERATVLDGGNAITYWNYLMGRLVLTGENQDDALEFLYNHNTTHFLIDSSDIGKYGAFSSIGSNEELDRFSWIGAFILDESKIQETKNQTVYFYTGGVSLDEDLIINENGAEVFLPGQRSGVGAIVLPIVGDNNEKGFTQPSVIIVSQGKQFKQPLRYLYINDKMMDFKSGIEAAAFIIPKIDTQGQNVKKNELGAAIFISPRLLRGMLSQVYLLNDPFNNFPNFKLVHNEPAFIVENLRSQGMALPDFVYFQGIQGPIKIWEIEYTGKEEIKQEYLDTDPTKYLSWEL